MANNYEINYNDEKFKQVESDKNAALTELEKTYGGMIDNSDKYYQNQIDAAKDWEKKQTQIQNEQTDFAIEKIEQQKDQEKKDYLKEQSGAYVDWQKQSNEFGAEAEAKAAQGMANTGFSESSKVSMYTTYQNRVATARESYNLAVLNYNNAIKDARLQNNAALAEIAKESLERQLELSLQGFQYKNQLILEQASRKTELDQIYHERWQDVLDQMNTENALAEQIRQHNEQLAEEKRQFDASMALEREQFEYQKEKASSSGSSGGSSGGSKGKGSSGGSGGGSNGDGGKIKKDSGSSGGALPKETAQSILNLGQGPISAQNLANQVANGTVKEGKSSSGNTIFTKTAKGLSKFGTLFGL